jgi:hypothetical protein
MLVQVLNSCLVLSGKHDVELKEGGHQAHNSEVQQKTEHDKDLSAKLRAVGGEHTFVVSPLDCLDKIVGEETKSHVSHDEDIDEKKQEVLSVPETNAIVDPWAVVVHIQNASIAGGAVMASLRLENVAHETVSASLVLVIAEMEAPEHRNLAWIRCHRLEEGPKQHYEQEVVDDQKWYPFFILYIQNFKISINLKESKKGRNLLCALGP